VQTLPPPIPVPPAPPVIPSHQVPRPPYQGPSSHSAACDMCSSRIRGVRYKCTACPDYDVCESCFRVSEEVHPGHSFAKVYKQGDIIVSIDPRSSRIR
jgi:next-to-BRCA1 protein 1